MSERLRWGDVLVAAIDACRVVGPRAEVVADESLANMIRKLNDARGDMDATYRRDVTEDAR